MKNLSHIRSVIYSTPWAITPAWLDTICEIVETHVANGETKSYTPRSKRTRRCLECKTGVMRPLMEQAQSGPVASGQSTCTSCGCICEDDKLPPYELRDGAALISLDGPLFPKANLMTLYSGATSYEEFISEFNHALNNSEVKKLLIISDSPGGSCLRLAETCSQIFAAREISTKPIYGFIDPMACSAAYAIISQCDRAYISESGMAGSIGTILKYNNWERAERNEGNDPVTLTSSDIKAFGTPQTLNQYQSLIDTLMAYYSQFKEIVARGRKGADIEKIAGAKCWIGKDAVSMGLCDGISTLEKILIELSDN